MQTIRRHYGREHGSHRFHKKPTLRLRCSHCDQDYDRPRPPVKCPSCKIDRGIWLHEIYAIIEVPVPLDTQDQGGSPHGICPVSPGTLAALEDHPAVDQAVLVAFMLAVRHAEAGE
ncbi:MAG: hypothetical protein STHCBS139747_001757 [Sporothrix thermara]